MSANKRYSVYDLTRYLQVQFAADPNLNNIVVRGEISNLTKHSSGHVYFTLKDAQAQLSCAMFKSVASRHHSDLPRHGDQVFVQGDIQVYPPRGSYQLIVKRLQRAGEGALHQKFLELKKKLQAEGLFESAHKKALPQYPRSIGIVTSPTGAVILDIQQTFTRRFPHVKLILAPTRVQGEAAADEIINSLQKLDRLRPDAIILARGGGSLEDLWSFNEESVARAIFALETPVVTGIGHETDFSIADFVSDKRASTPTAAAELLAPDAALLFRQLKEAEAKLAFSLRHFVNFKAQLLDDFQSRLSNLLLRRLEGHRAIVKESENQLRYLLKNSLSNAFHKLDLLESKLESMDVQKILSQGYSITLFEGKPIRKIEDLTKGQLIETLLTSGKITSNIESVDKEKNG